MKHALIKDNQLLQFHDFEVTPTINPVKGQWVEVVEEEYPSITDNQVAEQQQELIDGKWVISYTVRDKTPYELWGNKDYSVRIKASLSDVNSNAQLQEFVSKLLLWWSLNKLYHEVSNAYAYFYCNQILPEHQTMVNSFLGLIEIENIPEP